MTRGHHPQSWGNVGSAASLLPTSCHRKFRGSHQASHCSAAEQCSTDKEHTIAIFTAMIAASSASPPRTAFRKAGCLSKESMHWFCTGASDGDLLVRDKRVLFIVRNLLHRERPNTPLKMPSYSRIVLGMRPIRPMRHS